MFISTYILIETFDMVYFSLTKHVSLTYNDVMNSMIENFLEKNNINLDNNNTSLYSVKSVSEINPILYRHFLPGEHIKKYISIADILGYDYECMGLSTNLIFNLDHFFDSNGSTYQKRSIKMLEMERDEVVESLENLCLKDTAYVQECENNKYVVTTNGMHRYHALRFHYLNELSQIDPNDNEKIKQLKQKYIIQVEVTPVDYLKTYSYFLLRKINPQIRLDVEYDSSSKLTGNSELTYKDKKNILTDEQLLDLIMRKINENREILQDSLGMIDLYAEIIPSFKNFLEEHNINLFSQEVNV